MVAIPEFAAGAMENWGCVTYREVDLLIGAQASASQKQRVATVLIWDVENMIYSFWIWASYIIKKQ